MNTPRGLEEYRTAILASGFSIYDTIDIGSALYIPSPELEAILEPGLRGFSTAGLPIRTRSKVVKGRICELLGYPIPRSFKRTQPRFPGQNFDTYVQGANNLQIWNEQLDANRRYVLIREVDSTITKVRVVTGETLAVLDTTGTLTQKYQARLVPGQELVELVTDIDTLPLIPLLAENAYKCALESSVSYPETGKLMSITSIFSQLRGLIGKTFPDAGQAEAIAAIRLDFPSPDPPFQENYILDKFHQDKSFMTLFIINFDIATLRNECPFIRATTCQFHQFR